VSDVWTVLSARFRGLRSRARRDAVDHLAAGPREEVSANVSALYELRQAVDDAIDDEVIRGRAIGVQWDLLGTTKQQAQQRHKRAMARRGKLRTRVHGMSTAVDEIRRRAADFVDPLVTQRTRFPVVQAMSSEPGGRMRRSSQQQPRNQALTVKLSPSEKAAIQSAAAQRQLSLAAYVADTALAAAEGRTVPVGDTERELLRELMRVGTLLSLCRAQLVEAAAHQGAAGVPGPDLESAAACCKQAGVRAYDVAVKLSRILRRRA
jgi:Mobilization protein NikA